MSAEQPSICAGCGGDLPPGFLACPLCHRLTHAARLATLAQQAEAAEAAGDARGALDAWREALSLLPSGARQRENVAARIDALLPRVPAAERARPLQVEQSDAPVAARPPWAARAGVLGVAAALLWKLKLPLLFVLGKGKLLIAGLSQAGTLLSMLASFGVYWSVWGWRFAGGLVVALYVHEMGHVAALRRLGIPASAPMFVPGLGAFVRMDSYPATPIEDARVGLAGPLWGLGASVAAWAVHVATGAPIWAALTHASAWLNLFNLLPIAPLDGGRGFRALSRGQRAVVAVLFGLAFLATHDGLVLLLALVAGARLLGSGAHARGDARTLGEFGLLIVGLGALVLLARGAGSPL